MLYIDTEKFTNSLYTNMPRNEQHTWPLVKRFSILVDLLESEQQTPLRTSISSIGTQKIFDIYCKSFSHDVVH